MPLLASTQGGVAEGRGGFAFQLFGLRRQFLKSPANQQRLDKADHAGCEGVDADARGHAPQESESQHRGKQKGNGAR